MDDPSRHNIVGSGLSEPVRSCVWGVAVSGEIESFARPVNGVSSFSVVMYDWAVDSDSPWKLQGAMEHPEEMCWGQYLSVGPQATCLAQGHKLCVFNQPIDALAYSDKTDAILEPLPKLVVQVVRIDAFERQSLEGYGFIQVPAGGSHSIAIDLWAPPSTFSDKVLGVYKPLVSRLNCMDLIADKSDMVVQRSVGKLNVKLQVMAIRGRGRETHDESSKLEIDTSALTGPSFTPARARRVRSRSENDPSTN